MKKTKYVIGDILFILLAGFMASIPLLNKGVDGAVYQDLQFHLSRIESIKEGLLAGEFPLMMQSVWMEGKGYPVSIFYGDALLYVAAIFRMVGIPVVTSYKIFVWLANFATAASALICFKHIFGKNGSLCDIKDQDSLALKRDIRVLAPSYISAFLYVTASYRLMDIFVRAAVGEYLSFIFFPIIALAMFNILSEDVSGKNYFKNSLLLALGMTGLVETHLLSTVMTTFLLALVCILYAKRTFRKRTILCILAAIGETIAVNLYFFVPFLDYYINEPVYAGKGGDHSQAMQIRESGAYISQLFDFFGHIFGINIDDPDYRMQLTIGLALMFALLVSFILFVVMFRKYKIFVVGAMSVLTIWMSTNMFPWNSLEGYTHLFKLLSNVQFPWRYMAAAATFVSVLVGMIISGLVEKKKGLGLAFCGLLAVAAVATTLSFSNEYKNNYYMVNFAEYSEVDSGYMGACEYLKPGTTLDITEYIPENEQLDRYEIVREKGNKIVVHVTNSSDSSYVEIPKINYKGYKAFDNKGKKMDISNGYLNLINVSVPAGYDGEITVKFKQPVLWRISEIVSLLSVVLLAVLCKKNNQ